jgi:hypothetical protein
MSILVVGSVRLTLSNAVRERDRILGGSATYFSVAASFTEVRVVAVVGDDFGPADEAVFLEREIDTPTSSGCRGAVSLERRIRLRSECGTHARYAVKRFRRLQA